MRTSTLRNLSRKTPSSLPVRRFASTTATTPTPSAAATQTVNAAKETASSAATTVQVSAAKAGEKAAENPQVKAAMESATKMYDSAVAGASRVAGPVGQRVGSMLGAYREPVVSSFQTFTSLCRQVYIAEKLAPPTQLSTWTNAYSQMWSKGTSGDWWAGIWKSGQWVRFGVYVSARCGVVKEKGGKRCMGKIIDLAGGSGLEAYGIFKIGEMIGRRNMVGYKLKE